MTARLNTRQRLDRARSKILFAPLTGARVERTQVTRTGLGIKAIEIFGGKRHDGQ